MNWVDPHAVAWGSWNGKGGAVRLSGLVGDVCAPRGSYKSRERKVKMIDKERNVAKRVLSGWELSKCHPV